MGPRRCYLCNRERSDEIALHRIPKDPETSAAWVEFCKLNVIYDDISKVEICSNHFDIKDFINSKAKEFGGKLRLKFGAVPSTSISRNLFKMDPIQARSNLPLLVPGPSYSGVARSCSQSEDIPSSRSDVEIEPTTPKRKRFSQPRYVGEIKSPHLVTPRRAKRMFSLASKKIDLQAKKIKILQQKNRRLVKKVKKLDDLVNHLKKKNLISENCADFMMTDLPESLKEVISQKLQKRKSTQYSPELRKFALTLQFYSSTAYNYVRRVWRNLLPHPSTIRKWYSVVDGKPGFSKEAFKAISVRNEHSIIHMNIVLDEMSIRSQLLYADGTFYGGVDLGTNMPKESDMLTEATNALVFLAVGLNGHWKVPLGYFLIQGLSGTERANLLVKCFELLGETGAKVFSITFDGAPVNFNMCNQLGANFDIFSNDFKPWIINPVTKNKIFIFWDACHMLKLVRNSLGDKGSLVDMDGNYIRWQHLIKLQELQQHEGLHAATKLTKKHILFGDNRMNVKLAAQTLSERVFNAFRFVNSLKLSDFQGSNATGKFCLIFNNVFDLLNCRNKFSKKNQYNIPIEEKSLKFLKDSSQSFENYIINLKDCFGTPILKTNRKTGFLGFIICMRNIFELYEAVKKEGQDYLLSYKVSQDFIETFFSAIRSRGGFNNNPNAKQFESAYKRLLIRHEISSSYGSNCLADGVEILSVSSRKKSLIDPVIDEEDLGEYSQVDHDYISTLWGLTPYVENIVKYIAGFIVNRILNKKSLCPICASLLVDSNNVPLLIELKNRGKLIFPSKEVCRICILGEKIIRQNYGKIFTKKNIKAILCLQILSNLGTPFNSAVMNNHILSQDILDNHRVQLTKLIIEIFLNVRLYHEAKQKSTKDDNIRQKYTKLILFKNQ